MVTLKNRMRWNGWMRAVLRLLLALRAATLVRDVAACTMDNAGQFPDLEL